MKRREKREKRVKIYETLDYLILAHSPEDLNEETELLETVCPLDFLGLLEDAAVGLKLNETDPTRIFKYLLVPKIRRKYHLQRLALNYFVDQTPCVCSADEVISTFGRIKQNSIFNGLPFKCFDEYGEYFLFFTLPHHLREKIWKLHLKDSSIEISPKMVHPTLYLSGTTELLEFFEQSPFKSAEICFGGITEFYSRYRENLDEQESAAGKGKEAKRMAAEKQAALLHFVQQRLGIQLALNSIGMEPSWKWADKDRDFSKNLSTEVSSMEDMKEPQIEKTDKVCQCSPHFPALSKILSRKKIDVALFFSFFVPSVIELHGSRPVVCAVTLETRSCKCELALWWPNISNLKAAFYNRKDLEDIYELKEFLFEKEEEHLEEYGNVTTAMGAYLDEKIKEAENAENVKVYFFEWKDEDGVDVNGEISSAGGNGGIAGMSDMGWNLKGILPSFCRKCGLLCPVSDEVLLEIVRKEKRSEAEIDQVENRSNGINWIN